MMEAVFEDNRLKEFRDSDIPKPTTIDAQDLVAWKRNVATTKRIRL